MVILIVDKKPRSVPLQDKPINFPPLDNLHLELLENKRKLKPNPPLPQKRKPLPLKSEPSKETIPEKKHKEKYEKVHTKKSSDKKEKEPVETTETETDDNIKTDSDDSHDEPIKKKKKYSSSESSDIEKTTDDELIIELKEDSSVDESHKEKKNSNKNEHKEIEDEDEPEEIEIEEEKKEYDPYEGMTPQQREEEEKKEYMWRFRILKKKYKNPHIDIPEYNEHSDLNIMKTTYDRTIKELYLDDAVESYRTYLMGGFMCMEFACTQWLGVDLSGFTMQQSKIMHKYDRLLIELGEKSNTQWGANFPVEIRLLGFIILQAAIFYIGKIISSRFGNTIGELFKGMTGQPPQKEQPQEEEIQSPQSNSPSEQIKQENKRRMRGPKLKATDINNLYT